MKSTNAFCQTAKESLYQSEDRTIPRRTFVRRTVAMMIATGCAPAAHSQIGKQTQIADDLVGLSGEKSIDAGLKYLASQQKADGGFGAEMKQSAVAVSSLSGMAFLSSGSTPGRGQFGEQIARHLDFIITHTQQSGFVTDRASLANRPMYGHGFSTMFMAECFGMSPRDDLQEKIRSAVKIILQAQNPQGGWRYQPRRSEADISVTACVVMALRAASNAGFHVPSEAISRGVAYIQSCQNISTDGGFSYRVSRNVGTLPAADSKSAFARSAAAIAALYSAGIEELHNSREVKRGLTYLNTFRPDPKKDRPIEYFYYGHYYAAQAKWHAGGSDWEKWYPAIRDALIKRQATGGAWSSVYGKEYTTAMATIVLQIPKSYLPIFQR